MLLSRAQALTQLWQASCMYLKSLESLISKFGGSGFWKGYFGSPQLTASRNRVRFSSNSSITWRTSWQALSTMSPCSLLHHVWLCANRIAGQSPLLKRNHVWLDQNWHQSHLRCHRQPIFVKKAFIPARFHATVLIQLRWDDIKSSLLIRYRGSVTRSVVRLYKMHQTF